MEKLTLEQFVARVEHYIQTVNPKDDYCGGVNCLECPFWDAQLLNGRCKPMGKPTGGYAFAKKQVLKEQQDKLRDLFQ
jgi:hypothetical protein